MQVFLERFLLLPNILVPFLVRNMLRGLLGNKSYVKRDLYSLTSIRALYKCFKMYFFSG